MTTETRLLEMLGHGAPMLEVLNELCQFIDDHSPGAVSTVFLLDSEGIRLRPVAGPNAPRTWREEIDDLELGMYAGFCSTEAHGLQMMVGVNSDSLVAAYRQAAIREGLQMASFQPILSAEKQILGALALAYPQRHRRPEPHSEMMARAVHLAAIAIECYRNEQELREFSRRLSQSQDDERRRIGRELHDSTGQKLAALSMNLSMVQNHAAGGTSDTQDMLSDCIALTKDVSDEIRTLSYLLHPPLLDECGLESALQMYLRGINRREGLEVELEVPPRLQRLSEEAELAVFRVVQASLTNIHLHSGARQAIIKVHYVAEGLAVTISDHGCGIPAEVLNRSSFGRGAGVGIIGMKERLSQLGGRLEIESSEYGTRVRAIIPKRQFRKADALLAAAGK
jgi:signal transduction histidine kinase